jgi:hypothetical protein
MNVSNINLYIYRKTDARILIAPVLIPLHIFVNLFSYLENGNKLAGTTIGNELVSEARKINK